MADEDSISLENLQKYAELLAGEAKANAEVFIATLQSQNITMANAAQVADTLGISVNGITKAIRTSSGVIGDLTKELRSNFAILGDIIKTTTDDIENLGVRTGFALGSALNVIPRTSDAFSELGKVGNISGSMVYAGYSDIAPLFERIIGGITGSAKAADFLSKGFGRIAQSADIGTNLERNLVRLASRAGDLNSILNEEKTIFRDLQTESSSFATLTYEVAQATGASVEEVQKYALNLSPIPGSLRRTTLEIGGLRRTMSELEAVMKVATAYGMSNTETTDLMNFAYSNLNKTGKDAVSIVANIAATSQDTVLPLQLVSDYVQRTSGAFKVLGNNSMGAMNVLKAFTPVLKESGLGPSAIQEIVQSMTSGIEKMDIAHKAFVSGATGGPGGLAGGFEIDYLLKEGRLEEVMGKTMEAMQRQFGSAPVTLEDVHQTPELAGELLKQVAFLKDVAGIAQNDQQAYRILEAMQKGIPEELGKIREEERPNEVLENSLSLGNQLQERGNNELIKIYNQLSHLSDLAAISNAATLRNTIGSEGFTDILGSIKENATEIAKRGGAIGAEKPVTFERAVEEQKNYAADIGQGIKDATMSALDQFGVNSKTVEEFINKIIPIETKTQETTSSQAQSNTGLSNSVNSVLEKGKKQPEEEPGALEKIMEMFGFQQSKNVPVIGTDRRLEEGILKLPELSEQARPISIASAVSEVVNKERVVERPEKGRENEPLDGKIDINVKLEGLDTINATIDKKISIERRKLVQGALIGSNN